MESAVGMVLMMVVEMAATLVVLMVPAMVEQMAVRLVVLSVDRREHKLVEPLGHWKAVAMVGL
jgi:hypothetical protein